MLSGGYPEGAWESEGKFNGGIADWDLSSKVAFLLILRNVHYASSPLPKCQEQSVPFSDSGGGSSSEDPFHLYKFLLPSRTAGSIDKLKNMLQRRETQRVSSPFSQKSLSSMRGSTIEGQTQGCRDEIPRHPVRIGSLSSTSIR